MSSRANAELMHRAWQAVADGDVDALSSVIDEKAVWVATGEAPWAGRHDGLDAIIHMLATVGERMASYDANIIDVLASDDRVALLYHVLATIGERKLDLDYLLLAKVEGGRITQLETYPTQPEVLRSFWASIDELPDLNARTR